MKRQPIITGAACVDSPGFIRPTHDFRQTRKMLMTNAVVVRRTMALLRDELCKSAKPQRRLDAVRNLSDITLLDVHQALGDSSVFTIGQPMNIPIALWHAVNNALQT